MIEHMANEKVGYEQHVTQMSQQMTAVVVEKTDLEDKLQRLYATLRDESQNKGAIDEIFGTCIYLEQIV